MKNYLIVISFICFANVVLAESFSGTWTGQGTFTAGNSVESESVKIDLAIQQTPSKLIILDCVSNSRNMRCYDSSYDIENGDQIFAKDRKIGDIFPGKINIFNSHHQASEQMVIKLQLQSELHYRYSYLNMDGQMESRFAVLKPK